METPHKPPRTSGGLVADSADQAAEGAPSVLLAGDLVPPTRLTVTDLLVWPQYPARARFRCATSGMRSHTFAGPLLHDVAVSAIPSAVPALRKDRARLLVVVTGADGHQAVLSWAEIDPEFAWRPVLLATRQDGASLERRGPQLVVPHDQCGSRYIAAVTDIWIGVHHGAAVAG